MTAFRALSYFTREAVQGLRRSWKISLVAIATIAVSLFVSGLFLLLTENLARIVTDWQQQAKVVVYLRSASSAEDRARLATELESPPWVTGVEEIDAAQARGRFQQIFPSLADLVEGWEDEPLPASLEVGFDNRAAAADEFGAWIESLRLHPAVKMVDDDRDWLGHLATLVLLLRGLGLALGGVLVGAAVFTIASVIRLTVYLYRDEIEVMRLVGATDAFIRGPFYVEGVLQGLAGSLLALAALFATYQALAPDPQTISPLGHLLVARFLSLNHLLLLVALGSLAGLLGSAVSLRRATLEGGV